MKQGKTNIPYIYIILYMYFIVDCTFRQMQAKMSELVDSLKSSEKEFQEIAKEKKKLKKENENLLEKVEQLKQEVLTKETAFNEEVKKRQMENETIVKELKTELNQTIEEKRQVEESLIQETTKATAVQKNQDEELGKKQDELIHVQEQVKHVEEVTKEKIVVEEKLQKVTEDFSLLGQRITDMSELEIEKMNTQKTKVEKCFQEFEKRLEKQVVDIHTWKEEWLKRRQHDGLQHETKLMEIKQNLHLAEESRDTSKAEVDRLQIHCSELLEEITKLQKVIIDDG